MSGSSALGKEPRANVPVQESTAVTQSLYVIKSIPGKGQGLVAATRLPAGTRILAESPLITVSKTTNDKKKINKSIVDQLSALPENQREAYFSLTNIYGDGETKELGIARTNALPLGSNAAKGAVFLEASRINHACNNNAQNTWNENIRKLTIYATRDIQQGEEISIYYLGRLSKRSVRLASLSVKFRFACRCGLCSIGKEERILSDQRLEEIQELDDRIGSSDRITSSPLRVLHEVRKLLALLKEEGITGSSEARAYYDGFQVVVMHGDLARAGELAKRSSTVRAVVEGHDTPHMQQLNKLAADPSKHGSYGFSKKWETAVGDKPRDLDAKEFENWLWRMEADPLPCLADLRGDTAFPAFECLPDENDVDPEFFDTADGSHYRPCKHWCLLGEIVGIEYFMRLSLTVKDRAGQATRLMFYTNGRGQELPPYQLREGYTLAVLYAEQHRFLDSSVGIRHENPKFLKIFPVALKGLLELSDRVKKHAVKGEGGIACHTCGKRPDTLKKCARCTLFWYCGKACQAVGWNEKGHKGDCKLLQDSDLQGLFRLGWTEFEDFHAFT